MENDQSLAEMLRRLPLGFVGIAEFRLNTSTENSGQAGYAYSVSVSGKGRDKKVTVKKLCKVYGNGKR